VIVQGNVLQSLLAPAVTFADRYPGNTLAANRNNRYLAGDMNLIEGRAGLGDIDSS
jgi:hypothetical protein